MDHVCINECIRWASSNKTLHEIFAFVLDKVVVASQCKYGFITERMTDSAGAPFLRYHAVYGIPFDDVDMSKYLKNGYVDFVHTSALHTEIMKGKPIVCHDISGINMDKTDIPNGLIKNIVIHPLLNGSTVIGSFALSHETQLSDTILTKIESMTRLVNSIMIMVFDKRNLARHKDNFLANISHEIRTPLNGIVTCTRMLGEFALTDSQKELLCIINQCSIQLLDIANDILDYTKMLSGHMTLKNSVMSLRRTLVAPFNMYRDKAVERGLSLNVHIDPTIPDNLIGDSTRIAQIYMNLLGNATKYTSRGNITVSVTLLSESIDTVELKSSIIDTGTGISVDRLPTIFNAFQYNENYLRSDCGMGLGLPITKKLVELNDGTITIDSVLTKGTQVTFTMKLKKYVSVTDISVLKKYYTGKTALIVSKDSSRRRQLHEMLRKYNLSLFMAPDTEEAQLYLTDEIVPRLMIFDHTHMADFVQMSGIDRIVMSMLPIVDLHQDDFYLSLPPKEKDLQDILGMIYARNLNTIPIVEQVSEFSNTLKIVVAEDNDINQIMITKILHNLGYYDIKMTANGSALLSELINEDYDIAFVDLKMPVKDGIETIREFRQLSPFTKKTMIVAVTASMSEEIKGACYAPGVSMDGYITKPIDVRDLDTCLKMAVSRKYHRITS